MIFNKENRLYKAVQRSHIFQTILARPVGRLHFFPPKSVFPLPPPPPLQCWALIHAQWLLTRPDNITTINS